LTAQTAKTMGKQHLLGAPLEAPANQAMYTEWSISQTNHFTGHNVHS